MQQWWVRVLAAMMIVSLTGVGAFAQGSSTASISGVVVDSAGGVVPGADVTVKNNGTTESFTAVTSGQGVFSVPSLITGTYTVTVSLQGFKTVVLNTVVVNAGVPASVRATLEVGGISEQVIVQSTSQIVQTQTAAVSTTLDTRQVQSLPLSSRSAADFVVFLPGVQTAGGSRDSIVNGLPQGTINMTLDGVNIQDNTLKTTDGFFAMIAPRLDAVEEITDPTASPSADPSRSSICGWTTSRWSRSCDSTWSRAIRRSPSSVRRTSRARRRPTSRMRAGSTRSSPGVSASFGVSPV